METRCCICFENIEIPDEIGCKAHKYHTDCFFEWHIFQLKKSKETAECVICKTPLQIADMLKIEAKMDGLIVEAEKALREDDITRVIRIIEAKYDPYFQEKIIRLCISCGSFDMLKALKHCKVYFYWGEATDFQLLWEFFQDRNHMKTCWVLNDFSLDASINFTDTDIVDNLISSGQYDRALVLLGRFFATFTFEEQLRFCEFFYEACRSGKISFKPFGDSPLHIIESISGGNELPCECIETVVIELIRRQHKSMCQGDVLLVSELLNQCLKCRKTHFWAAVTLAIDHDDLEYFEFLWNLPDIDHKLTISMSALMNTLHKSKYEVFLSNFLESENIFRKTKTWKQLFY